MQNKIRIRIVSWSSIRVIFSYSCENNTVKKTVEEAIRRNIDLSYADLSGFDLSGVDFKNVDLIYANLKNTILCYANLSGTNLRYANLKYAKLYGANLLGANLYGAELSGADLSGARIDYPMGFPDGEFIGWKKVYGGGSSLIIKLKILKSSKRSRATTDEYRCDKARVLEIQNLDGSKSDLTEAVSIFYENFIYKAGKIAKADSWDNDRFKVHTHGIHFFLDREKAVKY